MPNHDPSHLAIALVLLSFGSAGCSASGDAPIEPKQPPHAGTVVGSPADSETPSVSDPDSSYWDIAEGDGTYPPTTARALGDADRCRGDMYEEVLDEAGVSRVMNAWNTPDGCAFLGSSWKDPIECQLLDGVNPDRPGALGPDWMAVVRYAVPGSDHFCIQADLDWLGGKIRTATIVQALGMGQGGAVTSSLGVQDRPDGRHGYDRGETWLLPFFYEPPPDRPLRVIGAFRRHVWPGGRRFSVSTRLMGRDDQVLVDNGALAASEAYIGRGDTERYAGIELGLTNLDTFYGATPWAPAARVRFSNLRAFRLR